MPYLAQPSEALRETFIEAVCEFQHEGEYYTNLDIEQLEAGFGSYVRDLLRRSDRATQDPDLVPDTILWLVDGGEYVGRVSIRHELNEFLSRFGGHIGYDIRPSKRRRGYGTLILKLALEKAKELGIRRALLTCDPDNTGSRKIIEHNGGVLQDEILVDGRRTLRYWIEIGQAKWLHGSMVDG